MNLDLVTLGDATIDTFLYPEEVEAFCTLKPEESYICFKYGDKIPVKDSVVAVGGNAANVAVSAARFGLDVATITHLGDDLAGEQILSQLKKEGVQTDWVTFQVKGKTNHSTIISLGSEHTILSYHAPRTYRLPHQLPSCDWAFLTSVGEGFESYYDQIISWVTSKHLHLAFAPGSRQMRATPSLLTPVLTTSQILFLNHEEAAHLLNQPSTQPVKTLLKSLHALGPQTVFITENIQGSYAFDGKDYWQANALVVSAAETTGAGDAYAAGCLAALISGKSLPDAMLQGIVNSASVVSQIGAQAGLLYKSQLSDWLTKAKTAKVKVRKI